MNVSWFLLLLCLGTQAIDTPCGPIEGSRQDGITLYQGIPFGRAGRFEHSVAAFCWTGTLKATKLGPACYNLGYTPPQGSSEDCLNLNIYVPENNSGKLLPVLFFVYGGGNEAGNNDDYNMESLARLMGDVIIVEPNYRLGTLGYLVHKPSSITGNYGIGDLLTALEFVRPLLASFGGDEKRVTLMGQSSGGTNILALLAAPRSVNLFQGAISLSGSPNITMSVEATSALHERYLLPAIGCPTSPPDQVKKCLLSRTATNLTNALGVIAGPPPSINPPNLPYSPYGNNLVGLSIVDGVIVVKPLLDALSVPIVDVPLIIQTCQAEMDPSLWEVDQLPNLAEYSNWLTKYLRDRKWPSPLANKLLALYSSQLQERIELGFETWLTDLGVTCGNDLIATTAASHFTKAVYRTHLVAPPSHLWNNRTRYAFHTWDMPVTGAHTWDSFVPRASDLAIGKALRNMWSRFIYDGELGSEWKKDGCSEIGAGGVPATCSSGSRCPLLLDMGFDASFWWVN